MILCLPLFLYGLQKCCQLCNTACGGKLFDRGGPGAAGGGQADAEGHPAGRLAAPGPPGGASALATTLGLNLGGLVPHSASSTPLLPLPVPSLALAHSQQQHQQASSPFFPRAAPPSTQQQQSAGTPTTTGSLPPSLANQSSPFAQQNNPLWFTLPLYGVQGKPHTD